MSADSGFDGTNTPQATRADAQSRESAPAEAVDTRTIYPGEGTEYVIGPGVERAGRCEAYERGPSDPLYRPLRIYTRDPGESVVEGSTTTLNVPYEPLKPGPAGAVFEVEDVDGDRRYPPVDLEDSRVLIGNGRRPSPADHLFHQQMVYAVCSSTYAVFRHALGRQPTWGFAGRKGRDRLLIRPHERDQQNAYYDPEAGELRFGYYTVEGTPRGRNVPGGVVFTCLSHDIVVHEVTHALLDGLRAHFNVPTRTDVLAFHEAFADLVAIFQHFSYSEVVLAGLRSSRGDVSRSRLLTDLATQFGHTVGSNGALRTSVQLENGELVIRPYKPDLGRYEMASTLVSAVFHAFDTLYRRRTERFVRLATGGTGRLPEGEMPEDLRQILAKEASKLAAQFLNLCIRAIDYCPPVDLELGEFLRAVVTADRDLVPDDPLGYREAWADAFAAHGIYPKGVTSLAEDALVWRGPRLAIEPAAELSFAKLQFRGDPARPAGQGELRRQAAHLGSLVARPELAEEFGCVLPGDARLGGDRVELPCVQSVRSSRRVGPDGQVVFDLVAEVTQVRHARRDGVEIPFYGGSTMILDPEGKIRFLIGKSVRDEKRLEHQIAFAKDADSGTTFWKDEGTRLVPFADSLRRLHEKG